MKAKIKVEDIDWSSMTLFDLLPIALMTSLALFLQLLIATFGGTIIYAIISFLSWIPTIFNYDVFYKYVLYKGILINPATDYILCCVIFYIGYPSIEKWRRKNRFKA